MRLFDWNNEKKVVGVLAYLEFVKAAGKTYVYVSEYVGKQEHTSKLEKRIMSLGRKQKALEKLRSWKNDEKTIPFDIKKEGKFVIEKWIRSVENRAAY